MSKILVTGGAGFIGSHLCEELIKEHGVIVIDNLSMGNNISFLMGNPNLTLINTDIVSHYGEFRAVFKKHKFDTVFHFASNSDISNSDPIIDIDNTLRTTLRTLELCREFKVKELVFASSSAIYGETKDLIMEDYGPLQPISHYGAAKLASEAFIGSYAKNFGIKSWVFRFPNVIGGRATHGVLFDLIKKIKLNKRELVVLGDGEQNKPYIHVKELVDAILFVWKNANKQINVYNISGIGRTTVKDIAKMIVEKSGTNTKIRYTGGSVGWVGDCPQYMYHIEKLIHLGWEPKTESNQAIKIAIDEIWSSI